jgi:hypothetical protein
MEENLTVQFKLPHNSKTFDPSTLQLAATLVPSDYTRVEFVQNHT